MGVESIYGAQSLEDVRSDSFGKRSDFGEMDNVSCEYVWSDDRLKLLPKPSDCLRNAANSGFWSTGMYVGENAAAERTADEGGLQF